MDADRAECAQCHPSHPPMTQTEGVANMKHRTCLAAILLIALMMSIGLQGTAFAREATKEITITVRKNDWGGRATSFEEAAVRLNEELAAKGENTHVTIDWWEPIGDDELVLQAQAGQIADVFLNSSVDIGWEIEAGLIQPIDWVADSAVFEGVSDQILQMMYYDGHYYGVLQDMDASPVFINKNILRNMGKTDEEIAQIVSDINSGNYTMGQLVDLAQQALAEGGAKYGFLVEDIRFEGWQGAAAWDNYNEAENKLVFDEAAIRKLYTFWKDAFDKGVITEGIGDIDTDMAAQLMLDDEVFCVFARSEFYRILADLKGLKISDAEYQTWFSDNLTWSYIPSIDEGGAVTSFSNPAMLYVGANVDAEKMPFVQRYLELMLSPDLQYNHTINSGKLPVTPDALELVMETLPFYADHYVMTSFTRVRSPINDYATLISGYTLGVQAILIEHSDVDTAFEYFLNDAQQNIEADSIQFNLGN